MRVLPTCRGPRENEGLTISGFIDQFGHCGFELLVCLVIISVVLFSLLYEMSHLFCIQFMLMLNLLLPILHESSVCINDCSNGFGLGLRLQDDFVDLVVKVGVP